MVCTHLNAVGFVFDASGIGAGMDWETFSLVGKGHFHLTCNGSASSSKVGQTWTEFWQFISKNYCSDLDPELHARYTAGDLSYMELVSSEAQPPQFAVHHTWHANFSDTINSIEFWIEARELDENTTFWWDVMSVRWYLDDRDEMSLYRETNPSYKSWSLDTVFLWSDHEELINRAWLMYELQLCLSKSKQIDFSCPTGCIACTHPYAGGAWEFGAFDPKIAQKLLKINSSKCTAFLDSDNQIIQAGFSKPGAHAKFDERLARIAAGPVIRLAAATNQTSKIEPIICARSFLANSSLLSGSLGETAVHIAAAVGSADALKMLLNSKMDPNSQDRHRETPLHYAALAGQATCARILLQSGANMFAESSYAETPIHVAKQRVTAFVPGVGHAAVTKLLEEEQESCSSNQVHELAAKEKAKAKEQQRTKAAADMAAAKETAAAAAAKLKSAQVPPLRWLVWR